MADKTYENVVIEREGEVTFLYLNRPEKRNALTPELLEGIEPVSALRLLRMVARQAGVDEQRRHARAEARRLGGSSDTLSLEKCATKTQVVDGLGTRVKVVIAVFIKQSDVPMAVREQVIADVARSVRDFYLLAAVE